MKGVRLNSRLLLSVMIVLLSQSLVGCGPNHTPSPNHPPDIVDEISVSPSTVEVGSTATMTVMAQDPDYDPITYIWEVQRGKVSQGPVNTPVITYFAPTTPGYDTVTVIVSDGRGGTDKASVTISVVYPATPEPPPTLAPTPLPTTPPTPIPLPTVPPTPTPLPPAPPVPPPAPPVESLTGKIAYPVYKDNRKYIFIAYLDTGVKSNLCKEDASEPAISPDGSRIAFRSWDASTLGLMVMNTDGTKPQGVSRNLEDACPCWALGESLVFHSTKAGPTPRLYMAGTWEGADGTNNVQDVRRGPDPAYGRYPAWVPDGRIVYEYFERSGDFRGLWVMNQDGSNPRPITDHPGDTMPSVSPHSDKVAFMSERTGKWEVYVVNIDGTALEQQLTHSRGYNSGLPTWSPDGNYIAFVSDRDAQWAIWVMKSDGSGERKLFDLGSPLPWGERISWAP